MDLKLKPFDFSQAVARADEALFKAKSGGRNQVCVLP